MDITTEVVTWASLIVAAVAVWRAALLTNRDYRRAKRDVDVFAKLSMLKIHAMTDHYDGVEQRQVLNDIGDRVQDMRNQYPELCEQFEAW